VAHNPKVASSNLAPATNILKGLRVFELEESVHNWYTNAAPCSGRLVFYALATIPSAINCPTASALAAIFCGLFACV
jgi:hypothetical protein